MKLNVVASASNVRNVATALSVLTKRGIIDPLRPHHVVPAAKASARYGPQPAAVITAAHRYPQSLAFADERGEWTYRELDDRSNALARGLQAAGLSDGSTIGLLARDHRGLILTLSAAGRAGIRVVLMNTGLAKPQFAEVVEREGVRAILHDSEFAGLLDALPPETPRIFTWVDDGYQLPNDAMTIESLIAGQATNPLPAPSKVAGFVILTSGTTGLPKGAPRAKVSPFDSVPILDRIPFPRNGTMAIVSPLFHSTGMGTWLLGTMLGNKVVLTRRFDPESTLRAIDEHKVDMLVAVPTMLHRILELGPDVIGKYDCSSLKVVLVSGAALSPELGTKFQDTFGQVLYNMYGSTEVAIATVAQPQDLRKAPGTAGRAPAMCTVTLFDDNDRPVRSANTVGRIFVANSLRFDAYTDGRKKRSINGALSTGDVGHFDDDGLLFVDGRDDDMIVSGGENVYPLEVENLLATRADIVEAAVVGVDDAEFGKRLHAFIVATADAKRDPEDIKAFIRGNLARYKVPREVTFIEALPRNATGKVVRRALSEPI